MDLKAFSENIEITLNELPEVTFFCRRPRFDELNNLSGDSIKRVRGIWEKNVTSWTGLENDGTDFPCTTENKKKLLDLNPFLCMSVVNKLADTWNNEFKAESGN
tara:strand:+ start:198 stop:509 length:312 start_codon:yes stop_codon:yes gene_type:complete